MCGGILWEQIETEKLKLPLDEQLCLPTEQFQRILEELKGQYGAGFAKKYREMTTREFCREMIDYMKSMELIQEEDGKVVIRQAVGKVIGRYPKDFLDRGGRDEQ